MVMTEPATAANEVKKNCICRSLCNPEVRAKSVVRKKNLAGVKVTKRDIVYELSSCRARYTRFNARITYFCWSRSSGLGHLVSDMPLMENGRLPMLARLLGTHYLKN